MDTVYRSKFYRYTTEVGRILSYLKDSLDEFNDGHYETSEVTTNDYNEQCLKIIFEDESYITISYNNQISGEGNNFAIEFFGKDYSYITNNGNRQLIGGSGRGSCIQLANVSFVETDFWCGLAGDNLFIASTAHIGVRYNTGDFNKLSFIVIKKNGGIIAQSYNGSSWKSIYTNNTALTSGRIAVMTPFESDIYVVEDYGCGANTSFAEEYTNSSDGKYWYEVPTRLNLGDSSYILLGGLAVKE